MELLDTSAPRWFPGTALMTTGRIVWTGSVASARCYLTYAVRLVYIFLHKATLRSRPPNAEGA